MWHRLRVDFQLAMVTFFGGFAAVGIIPFAIYRFSSGNWLAGTMDATIVTCLVAVLAYAWLGNNTNYAARLLVVINNVGCIAGVTVLGPAGLLWAFPVLLVNFLLLNRRWAVGVSTAMLAFLVIHGKAFQSTFEPAMFLVTTSLTSMVAFIFATRTASQREQLEMLALRDPLTGAQNRRALQNELQIAIKRFERDKVPVALAMLDLDHFKRINDDHGHGAGDDVLIGFTELIQRSTRTIDRFFRFGGEEFVLLMPNTECAGLRTIGDNLCEIIRQELRCHGETITVSIGGAQLQPGEVAHAWLARVDTALYAAKAAGRNQAIIDREHAA